MSIKVLVVDDSAFMRRILSDILNRDFRIEVIGTARNGKNCLDKLKELDPDVITMDVEMPVMNGLQALEQIMGESPKPVVMVSSLTKNGADSTVKAITLGAVDFIAKPSGAISLDMEKVDDHVIRKVVTASKSKVKRAASVEELGKEKTVILSQPKKRNQSSIIAVGTSTGGPRALQQVLTNLPAELPAPIVIVQHMPEGFTHSLADRLDKLSAIRVKEAESGEELINGTAYIAPGNSHMTVVKHKGRLMVQLDKTEAISGHRPSVNRLFSSLAQLSDIDTVSVVMTGMGADGTEGLIELKENCKQTYTIVESEDTCVVFGMPRAVIKTGLADVVAPLESISQNIVCAISQH